MTKAIKPLFVAALAVALAWLSAEPALARPRQRPLSYVSAPLLHPPPLMVKVRRAHPGSGYLFLDPFSSAPEPPLGQAGALIAEEDGEPVWFHPAPPGQVIVDFTAQRYRGQPVLTWWQGEIAVPPRFTNLPVGSPEPGASFVIYTNRYRPLLRFGAANGWTADLHEFLITPRNTALVIAAKVVPADLAPYGGPAEGSVEDFAIQELSLPSGRLLFEWDMLKHVPLSRSETKPPAHGVWDPYHLNSVREGPNGELIASARNTWAVYGISRATGSILWQLGGKGSTFALPPNARFYWQHDAQPHGPNLLSVFDDGCCNITAHGLEKPEQAARGLLLRLEPGHHRVRLVRAFTHRPPLYVPSQGNVQLLGGGRALVGWGQLPYISEYSRSAALLYEAALPEPDESYRAYRLPWVGRPIGGPALVVTRRAHRLLAYVSFNGATAVASYQLFGGNASAKLRLLRTVPRRGFQTAILVGRRLRYYRVAALDKAGRVIGRSKLVALGR